MPASSIGRGEVTTPTIDWYLSRGLHLTPLDVSDPDIKLRGKRPLYKSWTQRVVDRDTLIDRAARGHNLGFVIPDHVAVLDIDPRNGGDVSLQKLKRELGDFAAWHPIVKSGGSGWHVYGSIDVNLRTITANKAQLQGIDFLRRGHHVVIPGSWHYDKSRYYKWDSDSQVNDAVPAPWPKELIAYYLADKQPAKYDTDSAPSPCLSDDELTALLLQLDATGYSNHDQWFAIMCACHHATNGFGVKPFVAWSTSDPQYVGHDSVIKARWRTLSGKQNAITYGTLIKEIASKGGSIPATTEFKIAASHFADNPETVDGFIVKPIAAAPTDTRPTIVVDSDLPRIVRESVALLPQIEIYQRDGLLSIIDDVEHQHNSDVQIKAAVRDIPRSILTTRLMDAARWVRVTKTKTKTSVTPTRPDRDTVDALLEAREYPGTPCLVGLAESPFTRPDGSICQTDGYDKLTGFYLRLANSTFPSVPDTPTLDDAQRAYGLLCEAFCDFPFVGASDAAVPIAAVLTMLARPALGNVPAFLIEASLRGTGKTLLCDVIGLITTGRVVPKFAWPRGREWQNELEKRLDSVARDGSALICWDDLKSRAAIGGTAFDSRVTSNGVVKIRILGKTNAPELPWSTVMLINGNNIAASVQAETKRRIMPCRMAPDDARPEERSDFRHPDLLRWARENREALVTAGLTVLRYWVVSGRLALAATWGSFESWAQTVPSSIMLAGGPDIMVSRALVTDTTGDDDDADALELLKVIDERYAYAGVTPAELAICSLEHDDIKQACAAALGSGTPTKRECSQWLKQRVDQFFGTKQLIRRRDKNTYAYYVRETK